MKYKKLRQDIKDLLNTLPACNQIIFKKMYSHGDLDKDINDVVDDMPDSKIKRAFEQVINTHMKRL
jgi:hypothetical protein